MADLPSLPNPLSDLKLNISGTLPGETILTEWIKFQEVLYANASDDIKRKIADDLGNSLNRLWTIWERLLNLLHVPGKIDVSTNATTPGPTQGH